MKSKVINVIFTSFIMLTLLAGIARAMFFPKDINELENRYAEKFIPFSFGAALSGDYQDSVEKTFADQVPLAEKMKKLYNDTNSVFVKKCLAFFTGESRSYIKLGDKSIFGDYLVFNPSSFDIVKPSLDNRISAYNDMFKRYPQTEFYMYYIEKDTDINFETGEKLGAWEHLKGGLQLPAENMGVFSVNSFDEFAENFYRTDHHWKAPGSYKGYCSVMKLLGEEEVLEPEGEYTLPEPFSGSKAQSSDAASYSEEFIVYKYPFPKMDITINGAPFPDYGEQEAYKTGAEQHSNYGLFYGGDMGEIIFDTGNEEKEDILIIGESYDNAILKLIATHFNKTYSIDLRYYEPLVGKKFHLAEYIKQKDIKKVLLIGNIDYFVTDEFVPED